MSLTPFYKISHQDTGKDLTYLCSSLSFEESIEKDNLLSVAMVLDFPSELDEAYLQEGQIWTVLFGYKGGKQSSTRSVRVSDIEVSFKNNLRASVKCLDLGSQMKKKSRKRSFQNKRSSDIVEEIAKSYGLKTEIEQTSRIWKAINQAGKTDFEFISELSEKEPQYLFYIQDSTLFFTKRDLDKTAIRLYKWGEPPVIAFTPKSKDSGKKGEAAQIEVSGYNPDEGAEIVSVVSDDNDDQTRLGKYQNHYTADAEAAGVTGSGKVEAEGYAGKSVISSVSTESEAKDLGQSIKGKAALSNMEGTLDLIGDPTIEPDSIITVKTGSKKYSGNWFVVSVKHSLKGGGLYRTTVSLRKNATDLQVSENPEAKKKNQNLAREEGGSSKTKTVKPILYDANGDPKK